MSFEWNPNERPPVIEEHSRAKLTVLRDYLRAYFDKLSVGLPRDEFKLDMIDGFAGGGTFLEDNKIIDGTPLIMLEESNAAKCRLNEGRTKPIHFDFRYYFIDKKRAHIDHLEKVLRSRGYQTDDGEINVLCDQFENVTEKILREIVRRQPIAGRSIFLLDQCGYSRVKFSVIQSILRRLPTAEVILTFASDILINTLSERHSFIKSVAPVGLTQARINELIQRRDDGDRDRALVQRALRGEIRANTGATYDTPFFIRPRKSRRALWFLHLSRHPTARDVMIRCHWSNSNIFEHYGTGDFEMLGWDALRSEKTLNLFQFGEIENIELREALCNTMPPELFSLASGEPVTFDAVKRELANKTAARFSDLEAIILELFRGKEIEILGADGKHRTPRLTTLRPHDRIKMPEQSILLPPKRH